MDVARQQGELIDLIYDAGFDDDALKGLPAALASLIGGRSATLQLLDRDFDYLAYAEHYFTPQMWESYIPHFRDKDVWLTRAMNQPANQVLIFDDYVPYAEYVRTAFFNDFIRENGDDTVHGAGGRLTVPGGGMVALGIHRARKGGAFTADEARRLQPVLPHLVRLHALRGRLKDAQARADMAGAALDCFAYPVMVVRPDMTIALGNSAAERLLRQRAGISGLKGRLTCQDTDADRLLKQAVRGATALPAAAEAVTIRRPEAQAVRALVSPMPDRRTALIVFETGDAATGTLEHIAALYHLSRREIDLVRALMRGDSLEDFAAAHDVRISTARSQLSSVLRKTETERQAQLIAVLSRLPAVRPS